MGKVLFGIVAAFASLMLVDSLTCNTCPFGLFGFCLLPSTQACGTNVSVCSTSKATFPALKSFGGFSFAACMDNSTTCGTTNTFPLLSTTYNVTVSCCSTDKCNAVNAAPSTKMTFGAVASVAVLASLWGRIL